MPTRPFITLAGLLCALALAACGTMSAPGVAGVDAQSFVQAVEINPPGNPGSPTFAETLRQALTAEAARYGSAGRPLKLRVDLKKVHFRNVVAAMFLGDDNVAEGHVTVMDAASGAPKGGFDVQVNAERSSGGGWLSALDPTGIAATAQLVGGSGGGSKNEAAMSANFATEALRQTYGEARARAVYTARNP